MPSSVPFAFSRAPAASAHASVLAVSSTIPWPLDSGGHLRTYHLLRALAKRFDVRLVSSGSPDIADKGRVALAAAGVQPSYLDEAPRSLIGESAKILAAAIHREPYVMFARHRHRSIQRTLQRELAHKAPDVLYLDHLDSLLYADLRRSSRIVVDMHNVYSRLVARTAGEAKGVLRRQYLAGQAVLLARMERRAVEVAHTIMTVSADEAAYFSKIGARRVVVVPNGVDTKAFCSMPIAHRPAPPTILYVGSLGWPPNASAARFLATDVLPAVRVQLNDARLVIVGKDPPPHVTALADSTTHVEVAANVPDVTPFYRAAHVLAVPLQAGGGTRLKILEAFAAGVPVVSTQIGCEGIEAVDGRHLVIADRSRFAEAIVRLLRTPDQAEVLAHHARILARAKFDWEIVGALACNAVAGAADGRALEARSDRESEQVATEPRFSRL